MCFDLYKNIEINGLMCKKLIKMAIFVSNDFQILFRTTPENGSIRVVQYQSQILFLTRHLSISTYHRIKRPRSHLSH